MTTTLFLTKAQAEDIAAALAHLNNVSAVVPKIVIGHLVVLPSPKGSSITIQHADGTGWPECHDSMSDFDAAYGLQQG